MTDDVPGFPAADTVSGWPASWEPPQPAPANSDFRSGLQMLLNAESMENGSNTPDFILADYLLGCLAAFDAAMAARDRWNRPDDFPAVGDGG